jgi:hypothetical protein
MVAHIYETLPSIMKLKYFTDEERKDIDTDMRILIRGKVGDNAGRVILETIKRKDNNILPTEIITFNSNKVDPKVVTKFRNQQRLSQKIIADGVVNYLVKEKDTIIKLKSSADPKNKEKFMNFTCQLREFVELLETATQILFVQKILAAEGGIMLFTKISNAFASSILENINIINKAVGKSE